MDFTSANIVNIALLGLWGLLWLLGGWWIVRAAFNLRPQEEGIVGAAVGLILQTWLANLLARVLDLSLAFWLSSAILFLAGILFNLKKGWKSLFQLKIVPGHWIALLVLAYAFTGISRGLAIFDDYAHLPTTSLMAAGNIPPQFPLNPNAPYGYHYLLLLIAAGVARIGNFYVWTALDIARGASFGLAIVLTAVWVQRLTFSSLAGFFGGVFAAFAGGTRWLLLLLPEGVLKAVSGQVQMLGSAAQSAPDLTTALTGNWVIEGAGPFAFPFAYANGINSPGILAFGPNGCIGSAIGAPILLTFNRWRNVPLAFVVTTLLTAAGSLIGETGMLIGVASWGLIVLYQWIKNKSFRLPVPLTRWLGVLGLSIVISALQGGAWSELFQSLVNRFILGNPAGETYQTIGFQLVWPVTVVSSHLGILSVTNPWQLLAAILEIGPVLLALPLVVIWGLKALRNQRWYEASVILGGYLTVALLFVQFTGSAGVRNTSRLYSFIGTTGSFAVPVLWIWARKRSDTIKTLLAAWASVLIFGGMVLLGIEWVAAQKPVNSTFLSQIDATFYRNYWNKLDKESLVFDPYPYRGVTVFGLYTNSSQQWLVAKPEWETLSEKPDPYELRKAGFGYMYFDYVYWYDVDTVYKEALADPCVKLIEEIHEKHTEDFRRLLDIRSCTR